MNITFSKKEIIALILVMILVKSGFYLYPLAESHFGESAYIAVTKEFEKKSVQDMQADGKEDNNNIYYIGRPSCIDCRVAIKNTRVLYRICDEKNNQKMYYVRLKNEISDSERKYLDSISVDNIPTIVSFKDGEALQFEYDDITAEKFIEKFEDYMDGL